MNILRWFTGRYLLVVAACALAGCEAGTPPPKDAQAAADAQAATDATVIADPGPGTADVGSSGAPPDAEAADAGASADGAAELDADGVAVVDAPVVADALSDSGSLPVPPTLTMVMGTWPMNPKQEVTKCVVKRLDFADPSWVHAIHTKMAKGSHHLIVYRSDATQEQPTPFACTPFTDTLSGGSVPLMISQVSEDTLELPPGVAFHFAPKQMIRLEAHYLDYFPTPITAEVTVDFLTLPKEQVKSEADLMFYGTPDLSLPPGKTTSTPWLYLPVLPGSQVFALTGHTHALGTNVEVGLATSATDAAAQALYPPDGEPFDWSEPPMAKLAPAVAMGQDQGFRYRCTWENTTSQSVGFGESATKEMCFFWAYYYPSQGYRSCISPGKFKTYALQYGLKLGDSVCCPGDPVCGLMKIGLANYGK